MTDLVGNVGLNTATAQASITGLANLTEAQMKRIAQYVKASNKELQDTAKFAKEAANGDSYEKLAAGADKVAHSHAGVNRELLVLTHELSQGNFSRFGGSMLVLAERTNALEFAMTASGAAILGTVGAGLAFAATAAMGAIEADKFAKSLQLTGNYAALTQSSLDELAKAQSAQTGQSTKGARGSIEAAAGSGLFGPSEVAAASRAMGDYERITSATAEEALAKFKNIQDGVAKWAEEQNKQMHFLTLGEYDHIKSLEDAGNAELAANETLTLLAQTMESRSTPAVGALAATWKFFKDAVLDAGSAMAHVGVPDTLADHINGVKRQIGDLQTNNSGGSYDDRQRALISLQAELNSLVQQQFRNMEQLTNASNKAQQVQEAISSTKEAEVWIKKGRAVSAYTEALTKFHAEVASRAVSAAQGDGVAFSQADVRSGEDAIKKQFTPRPQGQQQANEYGNLEATIKAFNQTTDEETSRMGKLTDAQKFSIQAHEQLTKAGKKLSDQQRTNISAAIEEAAAHRQAADFIIAAQNASMAAISADTENQQRQQSIVESVIQAGNNQANAIVRQTQMIGKSASEITQGNELQKFDDMVGKALLGADDTTAARINEIAAAIRGNLLTQMSDLKKAQDGTFGEGFQTAMKDYVDTSQKSSAQGAKFFNDSVASMTSAITKFAETGSFSWKSLIDSMLSDIIRFGTNQGVAALFGTSNAPGAISGLLGAIGLGGGTGASGSAAASSATAYGGDYSTAGLAAAFGYANGIDYVPYNGFPAILHEGEKVTRRQDAATQRAGTGAANFDFSGAQYSFGAGVDSATMAQALRASQAQTQANVQRAMSTNGRFS